MDIEYETTPEDLYAFQWRGGFDSPWRAFWGPEEAEALFGLARSGREAAG